MAGSVTSTFSEPEDFEAALHSEGCRSLLITEPGRFWALLTQIVLHRLRLSTAEERLSRIAFIEVPGDMVLISIPTGNGALPVCGRIEMHVGEIMTVGPGAQIHVRTDGRRRWSAVWVPVADLVDYGSAWAETPFGVRPAAQRWRPLAAAGRHLRNLHATAIRMVTIRPQVFADAEAVHGLEQQLIDAVVECLASGPVHEGTRAERSHQDIMAHFERLVQTQLDRNMKEGEICETLGVSDRLLRSICAEHLGMSPTIYHRLRRMSLVRGILRRGDSDAGSVSQVARRYGFHSLGRFAVRYRALFGEPPSVTLARTRNPKSDR